MSARVWTQSDAFQTEANKENEGDQREPILEQFHLSHGHKKAQNTKACVFSADLVILCLFVATVLFKPL
jgi:hypothetical protein